MNARFVGGLLLGLAACTVPTKTGLLVHESELAPSQNLDGVWCSERAVRGVFSRAVLRSVEPRGITDQKGVTVAEAVESLRAPLLAPAPGTSVPAEATGPEVAIELLLTEMTPGSVAGRFWAGELGAGHARVQVAGRFVDARDGSVLCEIVQRTNASGVIGFRDFGGDAGPAMVREMLTMIGQAVRREVLERLAAPMD